MALRIIELEKRLLFDAAAAAVVADAAKATDSSNADHQADAGQDASHQAAAAADSAEHFGDHVTADPLAPAASSHVDVLVVDAQVRDAAQLMAMAKEGVIVVSYDHADSLAEILSAIEESLGGQKADSIAFASHGYNGRIYLNSETTVTQFSLAENQNLQGFWKGVGSLLNDGGQVNLLGCEVAQDGQQMLSSLDALLDSTGKNIDVNASLDDTGSVEGQNWFLEAGSVDASFYFNQHEINSWLGSLATFTVTNTSDNVATVGSLRWAVNQANVTPGSDIINFSIGGTFNLASTLTLSESLLIDGSTAPTAVNLVGTSGINVFTISAGTATIQNLEISGGARGINVSGASARLTLTDAYIHNNSSYGVFLDTNTTGSKLIGNDISLNGASGILVRGNNHLIQGNTLTENTGSGIEVGNSTATPNKYWVDGDALSGHKIVGNYIGTNNLFAADKGNTTYGIQVAGVANQPAFFQIEGNYIGSNGIDGININAAGVGKIIGNYIGTDSSKTINLGNGMDGVHLGSGQNTGVIQIGGVGVGEGNFIYFNEQNGVFVEGSPASGTSHSIQNNTINSNGSAGIRVSAASSTAGSMLIQGNIVGYNPDGLTNAAKYGDVTLWNRNGIQIQAGTLTSITLGGAGALKNFIGDHRAVLEQAGGAAVLQGGTTFNFTTVTNNNDFRVSSDSSWRFIPQVVTVSTASAATVNAALDFLSVGFGKFSVLSFYNVAASAVITGSINTVNNSIFFDGTTVTGYDFSSGSMLTVPQLTLTGADSLIEGIKIVGGVTISDSDITLKNVEVTGSSFSGITIGDDRARIVDSRIYSNTDAGIVFSSTSLTGSTIIGNTIYSNGAQGILLLGRNHLVQGNTIIQNTIGIEVGNTASVPSGYYSAGVETTGNKIVGNYIGTTDAWLTNVGNTSHGIYVNGSNQNFLQIGGVGEGNYIGRNGGDGIRIISGREIRVFNNYIGTNASGANLGNTGNGILISGGGGSSNYNIGLSSVAGSGNMIAFNGGNGIQVDFNTSQIYGNTIYSNALGGARLTFGTISSLKGNYLGFSSFDLSTLTGTVALDNNGEYELQVTGGTLAAVNFGGTSTADWNFIAGNGSALPISVLNAPFADWNYIMGLTYVVSNTNASGAGSLAQAIASSNASTLYTDTITFSIAANSTIAMGGTSLTLSDSVNVKGSTASGYVAGTNMVTVSGTSTIFNVATGYSRIEGINVTGGLVGVALTGVGNHLVDVNAYSNTDGVVINDSGNRITRGNFYSNSDMGIEIQSDGNTLTDAKVFDNALFGVYVVGSSGNTFNNLEVYNSSGSSPQDYGIYMTNSSQNNTIKGGSIYNHSAAGISIGTVNASGNVIGGMGALEGVTIYGNANGIVLSSSGNTVIGNTIRNNTNAEILLMSASSIIQGNTLGYGSGNGTGKYGIYLNSVSSSTITGNLIGSHTVAPIVFAGTNTGNTLSNTYDPVVYQVTSTADNIATEGTLRWAVDQSTKLANSADGIDRIVFSLAASANIVLSGSNLTLSTPVYVDGATASGYAAGTNMVTVTGVSGDVFNVTGNGVTLAGLNITGGTNGVAVSGSGNALIDVNSFGNTGAGVVVSGNNNTLTGGVIYNNISHGINLDAGAIGSVVQNNTIYNNGGHGIFLNNSSVEITDNMIYDHHFNSGIYLGVGATGSVIQDNIIHNNIVGITMFGASNSVTITENSIYGNTSYGIFVGDGVTGSVIQSNNIGYDSDSENATLYNGKYGIYLDSGVSGNTIGSVGFENLIGHHTLAPIGFGGSNSNTFANTYRPVVYQVTSTADNVATEGTLRWAVDQSIKLANSADGIDTIKFNALSYTDTINLTSDLVISESMFIDGKTVSGYDFSPTDYALKHLLSINPGAFATAFSITGDSVTIEGIRSSGSAGPSRTTFNISGDNNTLRYIASYSSSNGAYIVSGDGNTILDSAGFNSARGVWVNGASGTTITNFTGSNNAYGVLIGGAHVANTVITGLDMISNNFYAVFASNTLDATSTGNIIQNSNIHDSPSAGIEIQAAVSFTITGNTIYNNANGIRLLGSSSVVTNNTIYNNTNAGVYAANASPTITGNTIYGNTSYGISLDNASGSVVQSNIIYDNGNHGIFLADSSIEVVDNTIYNQGGAGVYLGAGSTGSVLQSNIIHHNATGITLFGASDAVTISGNIIYSNTSYGIFMGNGVTGSVVESNIIGYDPDSEDASLYNGKYGIYLAPGVSGNTIGSVGFENLIGHHTLAPIGFGGSNSNTFANIYRQVVYNVFSDADDISTEGTLRWAIDQSDQLVDSAEGVDRIAFSLAASANIVLSGSNLTLSNSVYIDGTTASGYVAGTNMITVTGIAGNVFNVTGNGVSVVGLNVTGGTNGIAVSGNNNMVSYVNAFNNTNAGLYISGDSNTINNNNIHNNANVGIYLQTGASFNVIQSNLIGYTGLFTDPEDASALLYNGDYGIFLNGVDHNTIGGVGTENYIGWHALNSVGFAGTNTENILINIIRPPVFRVTLTTDDVNAESTVGTLRWAVHRANSVLGSETIVFDLIVGSVINLTSSIVVTEGVLIDGADVVGLTVSGNGSLTRVFDINADFVTIKDLSVAGGESGIYIQGSDNQLVDVNAFDNQIGIQFTSNAEDNVIQRGFVYNNVTGIVLNGTNNTVGGLVTDAVLIYGNSTGIESQGGSSNKIQNNWIGLDANGDAAANTSYGVHVTGGSGLSITDNKIGSNTVGLQIDAGSPVVQGNWIGLSARGNGVGIVINTATATTIDGGNIIAENDTGVLVQSGTGHLLSGNEFDANDVGVDFNSSGNFVENNVFEDNATGVLLDAFGNTVSGGNQFHSNTVGVHFNVQGVGAANAVEDNVFDGNASGILVADARDIDLIVRNAFRENTNGIFITGGDAVIGGASIADANYFESGATGIRIEGGTPTVQYNKFGVDAFDVASNDLITGVLVEDSHDAVVLAHNTFLGYRDEGIAIVDSSNVDVAENILSPETLSLYNASGIRSSGSSDVSLHGNTISNSYAGIRLLSGSVSVTGNTLQENQNGIFDSANGSVIQNNTITDNENGVVLDGGSTDFANNTINGNAIGVAIYADGETFGEAGSNNWIFGNETGVHIFGDSNTIQDYAIGFNANEDAVANDVGVLVSGDYNILRDSVVSGNGVGVQLNGNSNTVQNNVIDMNIIDGVLIHGNSNQILGNTIVGNGANGVQITGDSNTLAGNWIGVNALGQDFGNGGAGILLSGDADQNMIGGALASAHNTIAYNHGAGIQVDGSNASGNTILGNSIYSNWGKGLWMSNGGNAGYETPLLYSVFFDWNYHDDPGNPIKQLILNGLINGPSNTDFLIQVYTNHPGDVEGRYYYGSFIVTTHSPTSFAQAFNVAQFPATTVFSITATNLTNGSTSEFVSTGGAAIERITKDPVAVAVRQVLPKPLPIDMTGNLGFGGDIDFLANGRGAGFSSVKGDPQLSSSGSHLGFDRLADMGDLTASFKVVNGEPFLLNHNQKVGFGETVTAFNQIFGNPGKMAQFQDKLEELAGQVPGDHQPDAPSKGERFINRVMGWFKS